MLKRVYLFSLVLLGSLMTAWADASTVTVKDQPTVNGETVKYADGSKTVAYTSANNAIWYLGDVDIAKLKSIEGNRATMCSVRCNRRRSVSSPGSAHPAACS